MAKHVLDGLDFDIPGIDDKQIITEEISDGDNVIPLDLGNCSDEAYVRAYNDLDLLGIRLVRQKQPDGRTVVALKYNRKELLLNLSHSTGRRNTVFETGFTWGQVEDLMVEAYSKESDLTMEEVRKMTGMTKTTFYNRVSSYKRHHVSRSQKFH